MILSNQVKSLNTTQFKSLNDTLLDASIAYEGGGNYREIFRRAKLRRVGLLRKIYGMLEQAPCEEIEIISKRFVMTE